MSYSTLTPLSAFATIPSTWLAQLLANTAALHDGTGFATGAIPTAAIADGAVTPVKMTGVDLFAIGGSFTASPPTAGSGQFYLQTGTSVLTFSSNASGLTLPTAFPNGTVAIITSAGDGSQSYGVVAASVTKTGATITSTTASGTQRFNWIAIGW